MKNISKKEEFIMEWLIQENHLDTLNTEFVDAYINAFSPPHKIMTFGANKCPELGRLLSSMYKRGIITRQSFGITNGAWQYGFPKWVWSYSIKSVN
jgi:hypothetical protein